MGSRRSRKLKARDTFDLEKAFARIKAEREGRPTREEAPKPSPVEKPKNKEERENPNHPCYKCIGCPGWTRCSGYYQLLECIEQRREAYERKLLEEGRNE